MNYLFNSLDIIIRVLKFIYPLNDQWVTSRYKVVAGEIVELIISRELIIRLSVKVI